MAITDMFSSTPKAEHDLEAQHLAASSALTSPQSSLMPSRLSTISADNTIASPQEAHLHDTMREKTERAPSSSSSTLANDATTSPSNPSAQPATDDVPIRHPLQRAHSSADSSSPDLPHEAPRDEKDELFEVHFEGPNDPLSPYAWSRASRWYYTIVGSLLVFNATFASSSPGGISAKMEADLHFGTEIASLALSIFLFGYCIGPLFWGPLSEIYGRRPVFIVSFIIYTGFQVGCALAPNTGALLVFRILGGCAAASPLANSGALIGDMWDGKTRGKALSLFTLAPFAGPALGPVVGGFIGTSAGVSWRWLFWVLTMFAGACLALIVFTLPETYGPAILRDKARRLRKETGDDRWWAPLERQVAEKGFGSRLGSILGKPFRMLALEPMLLAITVYMSFVYGCLYLLFEAYPIVFIEGHGFNAGENGLAFLPLFIGGIIGCFISVFYYNPRYVKLVEQHAPKSPPPEARLPMGVIGGALFAVGFFWFGWTSYPSVSYWAPLLSGLAFGVSLMFLFLSLLTYIIDTYLHESASALSANTILRSISGATFPLFARQMFDALNPRWASTLLGLVAVVMIPIPVLFIRYGPTLRAKSRYSPTA